MAPHLDEVLSRLKKVSGRANQYNALCPAHEDDQPSLRISIGRDDQVMLKCLRGDPCSITDIVKAINLEMSDLWPKEEPKAKVTKKLTNTYKYYNAEGELVLEVLRYLQSNGKKAFMQRRPNDTGGWEWATSGIEKPLYRLPQVLRAIAEGKTVWVVEGEKDVETYERFDMVATCNPGGAGGPGQQKWMPHHTASLKGANVVLVTDNDQPGVVHMKSIRDDLAGAGINVKTMAPPPEFKDSTDIVDKGGSLSDLVSIDIDAYSFTEDAYSEPDSETDSGHESKSTDSSMIDEFLASAVLIADSDEVDPDRKIELIRRKMDELAQPSTGGAIDRGVRVEWRPFLEEKVDLSYDWIIPGLLERQDRVIVVASEGAGKSTLARQVAMMTSAGLHPFKRDEITPLRTLFIDLENPERIIRRTAGRIYDRVKSTGRHEYMDGAHLVMKADGINLLMQPDQDMIEEHVEATKPDIIFFGPIYKSFLDPGGQTAESICTQLVRYFDKLRSRYDCAMWMEHHAPLGNGGNREMRPFGSAVWSRWSEFGIALTPDLEDPELIQFNHYRGQREPREWPILCKRGKTWPFEVVEFADFDEHEYEKDKRTPDEVYAAMTETLEATQGEVPF